MTASDDRTGPVLGPGFAGWLAGGVALLILLVGTALTGANGFLELVANGSTVFVPLPVFDAVLGALGPLAKGLLFAAIALVVPLTGALLALVLERAGLVGRAGGWGSALLVALIALVLAELVVLPLFGQGFFGSDHAGEQLALQLPLIAAALAYGAVLTASIAAGEPARSDRSSSTGVARARNTEEMAATRPGGPVGAAQASDVARARNTEDVAAMRPDDGPVAAAQASDVARARNTEEMAATRPDGPVGAAQASDAGSTPAGDPERGSAFGPIARRSFLRRALVALGGISLVASGVIVVGRIATAASKPLGGAAGRPLVDEFGVTPRVTPLEDFYVIGKDLLPTEVDLATWRLEISGLVDGPVEWTLEDLAGLPRVDGYRTLQCISNEVVRYGSLIGNQWWAGVRVRDVLDAVGVRPEARWVLWRSADGYTESLPLEVARDERTWLVTEMGSPGAALPREHGFPVRVLIAGRYGMKQPKYLTGIELASDDQPGYWEQRGWDETAAVRTYSRIDSPATGDDVPAGASFAVYGIASAGDRGIARVEVSADDGVTWTDAELEVVETGPGDVAWTRWRASVSVAAPGRAVLVARATDGEGGVQDAEVRPPLPSGATGLHRVTVAAIR